MKKFGSLISGIVIALFLGAFAFSRADLNDGFFIFYVRLAVAFALSFVLHIVIHEAGHLLFGLLSGYRFMSFRIASYLWQQSPQGIRFYRFHIPGTSGQCLMLPPPITDDRFPFRLYNLGGSLTNLISVVLVLLINATIGDGRGSPYFIYIFAAIGVFLALVNGIPMRVGMVANDGFNTRSLEKDSAALRAFWIQLAVHSELIRGKRLAEMPEEWFRLPSPDQMDNPMQSYIATLRVQLLMDNGRLVEAKELILWLLDNNYIKLELYQHLIRLDLIYLTLVLAEEPVQLEAANTASAELFVKLMPNYPTVIRTQIVMALLVDRDEAAARQAEKKLTDLKPQYPFPVEIEQEEKQIELAWQIYNAGKAKQQQSVINTTTEI